MVRYLAVVLVVSLISNAFSVPSVGLRRRRIPEDNVVYPYESAVIPVTDSSEVSAQSISTPSTTTVSISPNAQDKDDDDDDDDDFDTPSTSTGGGGGGSNLFSLLNIATSLMPASGSSSSGGNTVKNNNVIVKKIMKELIRMNRNQIKLVQRRKDVADNVIEIDYTDIKPPPLQKLELDDDDDQSEDSDSEGSDEDQGGEESVEKASNENGGSKQDSTSAGEAADDDDDDDNDSDYDEPPEGDGQGGGILGLLAGLSGDGDSDLGSLLAAVGGIVANLSGDGIDVNALIATGLGLFVGLLSEGNENPGEIIGNYLLTSLDTITGGGAQNNGAFFGKFLSTLIKGTSAGGDPNASGSSEEKGPKMADSAGFFASLLMGLLGEMSKTSSGSSWR